MAVGSVFNTDSEFSNPNYQTAVLQDRRIKEAAEAVKRRTGLERAVALSSHIGCSKKSSIASQRLVS